MHKLPYVAVTAALLLSGNTFSPPAHAQSDPCSTATRFVDTRVLEQSEDLAYTYASILSYSEYRTRSSTNSFGLSSRFLDLDLSEDSFNQQQTRLRNQENYEVRRQAAMRLVETKYPPEVVRAWAKCIEQTVGTNLLACNIAPFCGDGPGQSFVTTCRFNPPAGYDLTQQYQVKAVFGRTGRAETKQIQPNGAVIFDTLTRGNTFRGTFALERKNGANVISLTSKFVSGRCNPCIQRESEAAKIVGNCIGPPISLSFNEDSPIPGTVRRTAVSTPLQFNIDTNAPGAIFVNGQNKGICNISFVSPRYKALKWDKTLFSGDSSAAAVAIGVDETPGRPSAASYSVSKASSGIVTYKFSVEYEDLRANRCR